jgi:hypothetical protein
MRSIGSLTGSWIVAPLLRVACPLTVAPGQTVKGQTQESTPDERLMAADLNQCLPSNHEALFRASWLPA